MKTNAKRHLPPPILLSRVCKMRYKIVKKGNIAHVGTSHRGARNGGKCSTRFGDATVRHLYVHIPTPIKKSQGLVKISRRLVKKRSNVF